MSTEETAKYPPQKYTQKLLDLGIIEFVENEDDIDIVNIYYIVKDNFLLAFNDQNPPSVVDEFIENYFDDKFYNFRIKCDDGYDDENGYVNPEREDFDPEERITIYKKMEVSLD